MKIAFTDREADVMQVLWEHGASTVADVRARLSDKLAYTTVLSILRILETKGYLRHQQDGRGYRYVAEVEQQDAQTSALRHLLGKFFKGSSELLFTRLLSERKLSQEEISRMRKLLTSVSKEDGR